MALRDQCNCLGFRTNTQAPTSMSLSFQLVSHLTNEFIRSYIGNEFVS